jgi:hypothetical protein
MSSRSYLSLTAVKMFTVILVAVNCLTPAQSLDYQFSATRSSLGNSVTIEIVPHASQGSSERSSTSATKSDFESVSDGTPPAQIGSENTSDSVIIYLWSVYQRSPTKRDGHGDFTWKDQAAANRAGMSVQEYVIGGMDPDFREQLYHAGLAMDLAGIPWTILSGFRDDYRQGIAVGLKAHVGNSFHGGSVATGGYGHGCAVDVASVDGLSNQEVWQWFALHGAEFALRRPLPGLDPAHVQPRGAWHEFAALLRSKRTGLREAPEIVTAESDPPTSLAAGKTSWGDLSKNPRGACADIRFRIPEGKQATRKGESENKAATDNPITGPSAADLMVLKNSRAAGSLGITSDVSPVSKLSRPLDKRNQTWFIQLTGAASEAAALGSYYRLQRKFGRILGSYRPVVARPEARARWYRTRIAMDTRATADKLCASLRSAGGDCLVMPR